MMGEKLSVGIYTDIRDKIIRREIDDRTFLTENELAKQYSVSKAPIRDALHLLCSNGYLVSYPRKGYMVKLYTRSEVEQMQQVRLHLEKLSIELVIANASDEQIKDLRKYNEQYEYVTDPSMSNNARFHMGLARISGNPYLVSSLEPLINNISRYWIETSFDFKPHLEIIEALLKRDLSLALKCLESDFSH